MERSLFGFIIRYSRRDQLLIVPLVLATMVVYYLSLDLPKTIINKAIQGVGFPSAASTVSFLGFQLDRIDYLLALSVVFLGLIVLNGYLKFQINTMKGWMGERMLRRLRYALVDFVLRFPLLRFRRVKAAEVATMVKDEVEPLGGFVGESLITLMTTAALVFAMIPLLIASGPGAAARFSMGMVIASGMTIGTAFTLFVLPAFYLYLARDHAHDRDREKAAIEAEGPHGGPEPHTA